MFFVPVLDDLTSVYSEKFLERLLNRIFKSESKDKKLMLFRHLVITVFTTSFRSLKFTDISFASSRFSHSW